MKRTIFILMIGFLVASCKSEPENKLPANTYQVNVTGKGIYNGLRGHINAVTKRGTKMPVDTAMFVNEMATFYGEITSPVVRTLTINGVKGELDIILEPGVTNIDINKENITLSKIDGGPNIETHKKYKSEMEALSSAVKDLRKQANTARRQNDTLGYEKLAAQANEKIKEMDAFPSKFIENNSDSEYSLLLLDGLLSRKNVDVEKVKSNYAALENVINKSEENKRIGQNIQAFIAQKEAVKDVDLGKVAPEFSGPTPDGKELALSDIKGKATIIDFWASWCGPCRRENPNVVKVYEKYHDKGLEIISVSLDRPNQRQRWLQAIEKDKMTWHHVSNLQYWNDPIARKYSVKAIPAMFVLDEDGKIVAKKLRGKALEDQIASMLN